MIGRRIGPWADPRWSQRHDGWTAPFVLLADASRALGRLTQPYRKARP
jgi:hypothetical protein